MLLYLIAKLDILRVDSDCTEKYVHEFLLFGYVLQCQ